MLILGYGAIGEKTAQAAHGFGMKVIGLRRRDVSLVEGGVRIESASKLRQLLGETDILVNILPFTEDTQNFVGKEEFALMKKSALYVSVGRGQTTDQDALIEALKAKRIAAALLDVTSPEPLPPESPLWDMENVIITSHYAGQHPDYDALAMEITLENLGHYIRGEALRNEVDKNSGY
jgi:phosphoglycerate dehydrogenase-like enzyme